MSENYNMYICSAYFMQIWLRFYGLDPEKCFPFRKLGSKGNVIISLWEYLKASELKGLSKFVCSASKHNFSEWCVLAQLPLGPDLNLFELSSLISVEFSQLWHSKFLHPISSVETCCSSGPYSPLKHALPGLFYGIPRDLPSALSLLKWVKLRKSLLPIFRYFNPNTSGNGQLVQRT